MTDNEDNLLDVAPGIPHSNIVSETVAYVIGLALALILTAIPFALVATNPLPKPTTLIIIGVAAAIQVLVHLRYFLHLDLTSTPRENLVAIVFTAILIFLMVGGSFWIMFDLHNRMAM